MPDVNGSSFHLFLTERDWFPNPDSQPPELEWSPQCGLQLRRFVPFQPRLGAPRLGPDDLRGHDRDTHGTFWHIGEDRRSLWRTDERGAGQFWPRPAAAPAIRVFIPNGEDRPPQAPELGALAATSDGWLVAGVLDPGDGPMAGPGLLLFDVLTAGEPIWRDWSGFAPDFRPVAASSRPTGLLVLDAGAGRPTRVWPLDQHADPAVLESPDPVEEAFGDCDPDEATETRHPAVAGIPRPWTIDATNPCAIVALDETSYLVLDADANAVVHFRQETRVGQLELDTALASLPGGGGRLRGHDIAIAQMGERHILFVSDAGGLAVLTFDIDDDFAALPEYYAMRRHHGRGLIGDGGTVWFDTQRRWHPLLSRGRPAHVPSGTLSTAAADGREPGCRWHRIVIDGTIPTGTSLRVETRAGDDVEDLGSLPWRTEPTPYLRNAGAAGGTEGLGTWETLIQSSDGRYCQLRLTLEGGGRTSPRINALRLVRPRFSYLHQYLPQVFAEQDASTRFLERYLANPEGILTRLEGRIADADLLFDPRSVPPQHLGWLAGWLGVHFDAGLNARRRRLFLRHATRLFAMRGTPAGIVLALRLVLDQCPEEAFTGTAESTDPTVRIVERHAGRVAPIPLPAGREGRWTAELGAEELHERFRGQLLQRYGSDWSRNAPDQVPAWLRLLRDPAEVKVSPTTPDDPDERRDWARFLETQLGIRGPAFDPRGHLGLYRRFLMQRYARPERYARAYGTRTTAFDRIPAPNRLPSFGPALTDWEDFVSLVVPIESSAHHFSVLIPMPPDTPESEQSRRMDLAGRIVAAEKPPHTTFDVRPYWTAFRLGEARLGIDTHIEAGARWEATVLGSGRLAQGVLPGPASRSPITQQTPNRWEQR